VILEGIFLEVLVIGLDFISSGWGDGSFNNVCYSNLKLSSFRAPARLSKLSFLQSPAFSSAPGLFELISKSKVGHRPAGLEAKMLACRRQSGIFATGTVGR
jgi:hypothetical protein